MNLEPGSVVRWRFTFGGQTSVVVPLRVVRETTDGLYLWVAGNSPAWRADLPEGLHLRDVDPPDRPAGGFPLVAGTWFPDSALIYQPHGAGHAVWWRFDLRGAFTGWYVNLERRERSGADITVTDLELDLVVYPDRTWEWKDAESFAAKTGHPSYWTASEAGEIRAEGERVVKLAEAGMFPFDGTHCDFSPPAHWRAPARVALSRISPMVETRHCNTCGQDKPLTAEHWPLGGRTREFGYPCKICKAAELKRQREAALAEDAEAFRAAMAAKQQARRIALKEAAVLEQLTVFADAYDRLQAGGMAREDALREAAKTVPTLRVKGA
jgi:hypothetical protein